MSSYTDYLAALGIDLSWDYNITTLDEAREAKAQGKSASRTDYGPTPTVGEAIEQGYIDKQSVDEFNYRSHIGGLDQEKEKAWQEIKDFLFEHRLQISIGSLSGIFLGMAVQDPAYGQVLQGALEGAGKIIDGVLPG